METEQGLAAGETRRGAFFAKTEYRDKPLPDWAPTRLRLPEPTFSERHELTDCYWAAWEAAFERFRRPLLGSSLVSNYLDPGLDGRLRMWDVVCSCAYCDLAHDLVPGIRALDNFYCCQHPDGEICREVEADGRDHEAWINREGLPLFTRQSGRAADLGRESDVAALTLDGFAHPLLAWAEAESYRQTGDAGRVAEVWEPLWRHYLALRAHLRHTNGLFVANWAWMENSPRNAQLGCGVDASCQAALAARSLAALGPVAAREADAAGRGRQALAVRRAAAEAAADAEALGERIRDFMWDARTGFYYDLRPDGERLEVPTAAGFWALVSGVATAEQAGRLAGWVRDPEGFGTAHPVPSLAARARGYNPRGGYFRGGVFPPLVLMVVRGLERYGYGELAHEIAMRHVGAVADVWRETGSFWENYAPAEPAPGRPAREGYHGWSGVGPIALYLEYGLGLRADAPMRELHWTVRTLGYSACERYVFAGTRVDLSAPARASAEDPLYVTATVQRPTTLVVHVGSREKRVRARGKVEFEV